MVESIRFDFEREIEAEAMIHDWTSVPPGTFHDFHQGWTMALRARLNQTILPDDYYALAEQPTGDVTPDILTLPMRSGGDSDSSEPTGAVAVRVSPPSVKQSIEAERQWYLAKKNVLVIRHKSNDRTVAIIELVSPGNKSGRVTFDRFIEKATVALSHGIHLLLIDLFPPTRSQPLSIAQAVWVDLGEDPPNAPPDKPLVLAAFVADAPIRAYIEPSAVGDPFVAMPLFLTPQSYVSLPLEETYLAAFAGLPRHIQQQLQQTIPPGN